MTMLAKLAVMKAMPSLAIALFAAMPTAEAGKAVFERSKPHLNVGTIGHTARAKAPRNRFEARRAAPRRSAPVNQFKARTTAPPPPTGPSNLTAKPRVLKDLYCGGKHHVPCDYIFTNYCALIGGTMSPSGTTCYHPWEW